MALPPGPGGAPDVWRPAKCAPTKQIVCGPESQTRAAALQAQQKTLMSDKIRRQTSLPSLTKLFGKAGRKAQLKANSAALKAAAVARGSAMKSIGTVGGVKVKQGATTVDGESGELFDTGLSRQDQLTRGKNSQAHSLSIAIQTKRCPVAGESLSSNAGRVEGKIRAKQSWRSVLVTKGKRLVTQLTAELSSEDMFGLAVTDASYAGANPSGDGMSVVLTRTRTVTDLKTKKSSSEKPIKLEYPILMIDQWWMDGGSFEKFIKSQSDSNPADKVQSDSLLNETGFEEVATSFGELVAANVERAYEKAAQFWQTPNNCATITADLPARMNPGSSTPVNVTVAAGGRAPALLLATNGWLVPYRANGFTIDPYNYHHPLSDATRVYTLTAPGAAWPTGTGEVVIRYQSAYGVAEARQVVDPMGGEAMVYGVRIVGSGNFTEDTTFDPDDCGADDSYCVVRSHTAQFNFDDTWPFFAIPTDGGPGVPGWGGGDYPAMAQTADISGSFTENSYLNGNQSDSVSCNAGVLGPSSSPANDGHIAITGASVSVRPVNWLPINMSSPPCSGSGGWWGAGYRGNWVMAGFGAGGFGAVMWTSFTPTATELEAASFSRSVTSTPELADCSDAYTECSQTLSWSGTVTFTKKYECQLTAERVATSCKGPPF